MLSEGGRIEYPPIRTAAFLIDCLNGVGLSQSGMAGPEPISAAELRSWSEGSATVLGCYDFQDILDASRVYCSSVHEYDGHDVEAPWVPEMSEEDLKRVHDAQERAWDIAMGV